MLNMRTIETVNTREEWTWTWDGQPQTSPVMGSLEEVEDYIAGGIKAGNEPKRYGIVRREVVTVTTRWIGQ
jgi:hypothetical protein